MVIYRTPTGKVAPAPTHCPLGHKFGPSSIQVGSQWCSCGKVHRTRFCHACEATTYTPPVGDRCRPRTFDAR